jgi:subtilisin family serine protease
LRVVLRARSGSAADASRLASLLTASGRFDYALQETFRPMELRGRYVPNDPLFAEQWALANFGQGGRGGGGADVGATTAWRYTLGSPEITIAVLDDGVQLDHPDLAANIIDAGRDFTVYPSVAGAGPRAAQDRHGTSVAGIAAARGDNEIGVSGMCPRCTILPIRVHGSSNLGTAAAFHYAVEQGADIITNSWGYTRGSAAADDAVRDAIDAAASSGRGGRGALVVFGMTNESVDNCGPQADIASLDSVVAVGVANHNDEIGGSGFGACMDLVAPAKPKDRGTIGNTTTDRTGIDGHTAGDYTSAFGGTSAAAPLVAGIAGLLLSLNPDLRREDLQRILEHTAEKIDPAAAAYDPTGFSARAGYGRVSAARALVPTVTIRVNPTRVERGEPFSVTVSASAPFGLESVSWRGRATDADAIDAVHTRTLSGAAVETLTWSGLTIETAGTYVFVADARDARHARPVPAYPHRASDAATSPLAELTVVERSAGVSR